MKSLIVAKAGTVISEQANVADIKSYPECVQKNGRITQTAREVYVKGRGIYDGIRFYNNGRYNDGKKLGNYACSGTDILLDGKKISTTSTTYPKCITNKGWGSPKTEGKVTFIAGGKTSTTDFTGYRFFNNNRVGTPTGRVVNYACSPDNTIISIESDASADAKTAAQRQSNINNTFCNVKNGVIVNPSSRYNNTKWEDWKTMFKPTDAELAAAKTSCPNVTTPLSGQETSTLNSGSSNRGKSSVNDRFANSAKSLGVEGGKMDLQTLQTILKNLESETPTTAAAPTQGTPDLAQLTAALNQLEA